MQCSDETVAKLLLASAPKLCCERAKVNDPNTQALASVEAAAKLRMHQYPVQENYCKTVTSSAPKQLPCDGGRHRQPIDAPVDPQLRSRDAAKQLNITKGLVNSYTNFVVNIYVHENSKVVFEI